MLPFLCYIIEVNTYYMSLKTRLTPSYHFISESHHQ